MAVKKDMKNILNGLKISNHKFINMLTDGVNRSVEGSIADLKLTPEGRKQSGTMISLKLVGQTYTEDPEQAQKKINDVMQKLRNANILINLIK